MVWYAASSLDPLAMSPNVFLRSFDLAIVVIDVRGRKRLLHIAVLFKVHAKQIVLFTEKASF